MKAKARKKQAEPDSEAESVEFERSHVNVEMVIEDDVSVDNVTIEFIKSDDEVDSDADLKDLCKDVAPKIAKQFQRKF